MDVIKWRCLTFDLDGLRLYSIYESPASSYYRMSDTQVQYLSICVWGLTPHCHDVHLLGQNFIFDRLLDCYGNG